MATVQTIDPFIYTTTTIFHSLIDNRSFPAAKNRELALQKCREHVVALIEQQDGGTPQHRTLSERRNLFVAMTP